MDRPIDATPTPPRVWSVWDFFVWTQAGAPSRGTGLHARALTFLHPVRYEPITLTAEPPRPWRGRFAYLFREGWS